MDLLGWFWVVLGYLIGALNGGIMVCRAFGVTDPRKKGSGNAGSTNVLRVHGKVLALFTLLFDMLKGYLPVSLLLHAHAPSTPIALVAMALFLGHLFPIYFRFKGGKGVAVTAGIGLALAPMILGYALLTWLALLTFTRRVSVASMGAAFTIAVLTSIQYPNAWCLLPISVMVILAHHANICRLVQGKEAPISWSAK